jgi:hypothetical protein
MDLDPAGALQQRSNAREGPQVVQVPLRLRPLLQKRRQFPQVRVRHLPRPPQLPFPPGRAAFPRSQTIPAQYRRTADVQAPRYLRLGNAIRQQTHAFPAAGFQGGEVSFLPSVLLHAGTIASVTYLRKTQ